MKRLLTVLFLLFASSAFAAPISVPSFVSPDDVSIASLENFRTTVVDAINSADGGLLQSETVTTAALDQNANPENRWNDAFNDFVFTGLLPVTGASLTTDIAAGRAYIEGVRVVKDATANTYTSNKMTYVDLSKTGVFTFQETGLGADPPAVAANSIRLARVSTDWTTVASIDDLRTTNIVLTTTSVLSVISDTDEDTRVDVEKNTDEDIIRFDTAGTERVTIQVGKVEPTTDDDIDLGSISKEFKDLYIDGIAYTDVLSADMITVMAMSSEETHIRFLGDPTNTVPQDGDLWYTGTELKFRNDTTTVNLSSLGDAQFLVRPTVDQDNLDETSVPNIAFGTEIYDVGNDFSTPSFTAPATGKYLLCVTLCLEDLDTVSTLITFDIETSNRSYVFNISPNQFAADVSTWYVNRCVIADMDSADTAKVTFNQTGGTSQVDVTTDSSFSGMRLQ